MSVPVYVDFDDVLCESARTLASISGEKYGKGVQFDEIYSFDLDLSFGLDANEKQDLFALFHDAEMLASIPPIPDAIRGMQSWANAGCTIEIVTGRPPVTQGVSCAWLHKYDVPYDRIIFVDKYRRGHGDVSGVLQFSLEQIVARSYALAVDDSPTMISYLATATSWPLVVFDRPWNRSLDISRLRTGVDRLSSWNALLECHPCPGEES